MLKNVVLPAPFGPIRLTIAPSGIAKSTSETATRPPNSLRIAVASSRFAIRTPPSRAVATRRASRRRTGTRRGPPARARACAGHSAAGPAADSSMTSTMIDPVDPAGVLRHVDVRPEVEVHPGAGVREPLLVEVREERGPEHHPPHVAHPAEDDHAEDEHRDVEVEVLGERRALERREVRARESAEERAAGVRPGLRPHQRNAHRRGGDLVLADRDPGTSEPRVAQTDRAEHREAEQQQRRPVEDARAVRVGQVAGGKEPSGPVVQPVAETGRVDRRDPLRAAGQVEARRGRSRCGRSGEGSRRSRA